MDEKPIAPRPWTAIPAGKGYGAAYARILDAAGEYVATAIASEAPRIVERANAVPSATVPTDGFKECGYGDEDECWGDSIDDYVNSRLMGEVDPDAFEIGHEFTVDHFLSRRETYRVVSVDPIVCEEVSPQRNTVRTEVVAHPDKMRQAAIRVLEMLEAEGYGSTEPTDALRTALECRECPDADCSDCPRKPARWVPQS